ncbi:MAG: FAD-binding domain-containing protein [Actinomycetota bacterium]
MPILPTPRTGQAGAEAFVAEFLGDLVADRVRASRSIRGGQRAADAALAGFELDGYADWRNQVWPPERRGASRLSRYIRHGLLHLSEVWDAVAGGPARDVGKFRDELLWQEYARHWYAVLGPRSARGTRRSMQSDPAAGPVGAHIETRAGWDDSMRCVGQCLEELENDGWLVNQSRMWLASDWSVRRGHEWRTGEEYFFRHLLDGSRAANRLGWQWTTGVGSSKSYGFSRSQVECRAPGLCRSCERAADCPIETWPDDPFYRTAAVAEPVVADAAGPLDSIWTNEPKRVWLTAESLGVADPALEAHPDLPVSFVFDEVLLGRLLLSSKRLVFLVETLAELAEHRELELRRGDPVSELGGQSVAVTFAPVPGFRRHSAGIEPAVVHPWPWLRIPDPAIEARSVRSFSAWRKRASRSRQHQD